MRGGSPMSLPGEARGPTEIPNARKRPKPPRPHTAAGGFRFSGDLLERPSMLLTITCTQSPATDLGFLLHKHPDRFQSFELAYGRAHVFYPEASAERCTAALLLEVDPVGLVRGRRGPAGEDRALEQYVNDRPYV